MKRRKTKKSRKHVAKPGARLTRRRSGISRQKGYGVLTRSVAAILKWGQEAEGLGAGVARALRGIEGERVRVNGGKFVEKLQRDRPILEELYVWAAGSGRSSADLEEGKSLVRNLFAALNEEFEISIIHEPGSVIPTPSPRSRRYRFTDRHQSNVLRAKVFLPGLRQGLRVLSPCVVRQGGE
ncbi:MAG: hypothetical protein WB626_00075 [Bacteroidota bacterium]